MRVSLIVCVKISLTWCNVLNFILYNYFRWALGPSGLQQVTWITLFLRLYTFSYNCTPVWRVYPPNTHHSAVNQYYRFQFEASATNFDQIRTMMQPYNETTIGVTSIESTRQSMYMHEGRLSKEMAALISLRENAPLMTATNSGLWFRFAIVVPLRHANIPSCT